MQKAFSKMTKRSRSQRSQPKHSRGETACVKCASNKTKCTKSTTDPQGRCTKCIDKKFECQWPSERAGRACRSCRDAKMRCAHVGSRSTTYNGAEHAHAEAGPASTPPPIAGPSNAAVILHPGPEPVQPHPAGPQPLLRVDTAMNSYDTPGTPPSVASSPRSDYWSVVLSDDSR